MNNTRNVSVVMIFAIAFILAMPAVSSVNAQGMPAAPQMQMVSGKYTNPDSGLEIVLPAGWNGFEMKTVNGTMVSASMQSGDTNTMQSTAMMVAMLDKSVVKTAPSTQPPANPNQKEQCKQDSTSPVTINDMSGVQYIMSCTGDVSTKMKLITFQTDKYYISTMFVDNSVTYDTNVAAFDSSVNTLQIPNTIGAPSTPPASQPTETTPNAAVPEFPVAMVGSIMALMVGIAIFATKRQQLFRIKN